ncbi:hypothetical protein [Shinella zoogloeoides]|uniref:hypothetical protein n=1 Tax=Shinella zoogloeoides TaxID=352475 RepID=UPI0028AB0C4F|nr:hypothetical protein [Shinella zoogloeoides]
MDKRFIWRKGLERQVRPACQRPDQSSLIALLIHGYSMIAVVFGIKQLLDQREAKGLAMLYRREAAGM